MYSFKDFLQFLWQRWKTIVVMTLCCMATGCAGFVFLDGFQYTNQVSFLLPVTEQTVEAGDGTDEQEMENTIVASNIKLIETYKELVKSDGVLQELQKEHPHQSKQSLLNALTVTSSINSQLFTVNVTTDSPEQSQKIALRLSKSYPQIVENSQLPRKVFLLSAQSVETIRTPDIFRLVLGVFFISFIFSTSSSFIWSYLCERKFLRTPETLQKLVEAEPLGIVDFYDR
ncbi:hypothetical protein IGI39_004478 [Enterococcus sp. AZ135]|uniref:YveK family protein n=1 Tax=unclassified Enterococcus TaxID=2608891 RepID=UPI003F27DF7C